VEEEEREEEVDIRESSPLLSKETDDEVVGSHVKE